MRCYAEQSAKMVQRVQLLGSSAQHAHADMQGDCCRFAACNEAGRRSSHLHFGVAAARLREGIRLQLILHRAASPAPPLCTCQQMSWSPSCSCEVA